ncbi:flotillin family protein [Nostoc punctiforme FACHB-252]|uniref:Flotillin family protein n=1 Tax=Nostoc punctiforme FACHB-252 TaxID=1357509 RepID=A0ABR8HCG4_NOSPU|nr:SPFH domain-containing protein [Nostoc punctiforme]MBD2613346.1 flotillin family protein [Nostoc punctiforme FACHB-252]
MLFWLIFLQSLPSVKIAEVPEIKLQQQKQITLIDQTLPVKVMPSFAQIDGGLVFPAVIGGLVLLLLFSLFAYTRVYVVTPNNEAFVRTGGLFIKKKAVILYGGCIILPGFHQLTRVPLREISIDVERTGKLAVRTKDYLRADIRVTFYVCINASEEDVLTAAARLSQSGTKITPEDIKNALEKRADDAIRAAAKTKELAEIDSDKLGFAQEVLNLVGPDLKKVGLTLNNIAISEILESVTYDPDNFFDAQGVRLRTEIIQRSIQQKREVELATQVTIEQKELDAEKRSLQIAQEQESAKLEQKLQVEALKAQREREIQESKDREAATVRRTKILQEKSVEEEEIRKKLAVQQSQIEADIALEERNKQLKVVQALQKQESELAEITRQQTVESGKLQAQVQIVESERLAKLAQEDVAIAIANKKRESFLAQAEQAKAEESVKTASEVEKAQRNQCLSIIAAEREAQEKNISDRNVVEIDAFRRRRQAEIAQEAAELEAEAIRTLAAANRDQVLAEAEGIRAKIAAENSISNANLTAKIITTIWPELADKLPEIVTALAPQPGVLGDTRIYSFPGANGSNGSQDINKLLLSTSGLSLINTLLEEGKLGELIGQINQLVRGNNQVITSTLTHPTLENPPIPTDGKNL